MSVIVLAPAPFKGALSAPAAAEALGVGIRIADPGVDIRLVPVADGGEGTRDALVAATGGHTRDVPVLDPLGRPIDAAVGLLPNGLAVVELAAASGFERLATEERDPEATSTYGTGQLISAALDAGASEIVVGVGGSATTDGGLGLARALGVRILDSAGRELDGRGADLSAVARLDLGGRDPRLEGVDVVVACDVDAPLVGPDGAARVFGPQKGASPEGVERLEAGLAHLAEVLRRDTGVDVADLAGAGAAGGAAGGLVAMLGARMRPGAPLVLSAVGFAGSLAGATLCITGEGRLDSTTVAGKAPAAVAVACREAGVPCVAVCGQIDLLPGLVRRLGYSAAFPIGRASAARDPLLSTADDLAAMGASLAGLLSALTSRGAAGGEPQVR